jgi:hypothetical protein
MPRDEDSCCLIDAAEPFPSAHFRAGSANQVHFPRPKLESERRLARRRLLPLARQSVCEKGSPILRETSASRQRFRTIIGASRKDLVSRRKLTGIVAAAHHSWTPPDAS